MEEEASILARKGSEVQQGASDFIMTAPCLPPKMTRCRLKKKSQNMFLSKRNHQFPTSYETIAIFQNAPSFDARDHFQLEEVCDYLYSGCTIANTRFTHRESPIFILKLPPQSISRPHCMGSFGSGTLWAQPNMSWKWKTCSVTQSVSASSFFDIANEKEKCLNSFFVGDR